MAAEPSSGGDASKHNVKKDKKKKKEDKKKNEEATEKRGQDQKFHAAVENLGAEGDTVEGKQSNKSKRKRSDASEASVGDQFVTRKDKKRKKKHPFVLEESSQKQKLDTTVRNSVTETDKVQGKQSSKSKKISRKRNDAGEASSGDQVVTTEDNKRKKKHPVLLENSSHPKNTSKGVNGEINERGKEGNKSSQKVSTNVSSGGEEADVDFKNDRKKQKSKRRGNEGEKSSPEFNENASAQEEDADVDGENDKKKKNNGKRVSFADSAEVFETEGGDVEGIKEGKKKKKAAQSKKKGKRLSFADSAEVFSIEGDDAEGGNRDESKLVHGQRFTPEEDATLMEAIRDYMELKQLGEEGLEMLRSRSRNKPPELRNCWNDIAKSLPHRPRIAIYMRAHILLNRSDERKWTQEEKEYILRFVEKNGKDWTTLARELGKCDIHVKDTWRRIKSENLKKGFWTQDEHQKLFDLVNLDLRVKAHQIKNCNNRKLRDNIAWEDISDKLTTRNHKNCCLKWYNTLASPLVRKGIWADVDDYLLVQALQKDDAVCVEDVDWDNLLDHRSGEVCRQRWNQMVRGIGGHREKPFIEQVEVLSRRYCPEMIEYRKPQE